MQLISLIPGLIPLCFLDCILDFSKKVTFLVRKRSRRDLGG